MFKFLMIATTLLFAGCAAHKPHLEELPMGKTSATESIDMRGKKITTFILFNAVEKLLVLL